MLASTDCRPDSRCLPSLDQAAPADPPLSRANLQQLNNRQDVQMICDDEGARRKELTESMQREAASSEGNALVNDGSHFGRCEEGALTAEQAALSMQERNEKYYKKFDFFYRRTAFRSMTEFYKGLFKPNLDKWREGERKSTKNFVLNYLWKKSELEYRGSSDQNDMKKLQVLVNQQANCQKLQNLSR